LEPEPPLQGTSEAFLPRPIALPLLTKFDRNGILSGWPFSSPLLFVERESFQAELRDLLHQAPSFLIIGNPLADRLLHGLRDVDHPSLSTYPEGQVKAGMKLAPGALAAGLSAGSLHCDQAAEDKGLLVKDLGEAGTGSSFRIGEMASGTHGNYLLLSDII